MKKVVVWYSIRNGGDGSANLRWFLTEEESEIDQEKMEEGWGEICNGSVETFEGSDIHKRAVKNFSERKHEYLKSEDYYENRSVGSGRKQKTCEHCGGTIDIGTAHDVHHFYPEFNSYPTHKKCTKDFMKSLN